MRSGFHASRKPFEPGHYKPTGSWTPTHNADAGVNARRTCRVNSTRRYSPTGPESELKFHVFAVAPMNL